MLVMHLSFLQVLFFFYVYVWQYTDTANMLSGILIHDMGLNVVWGGVLCISMIGRWRGCGLFTACQGVIE